MFLSKQSGRFEESTDRRYSFRLPIIAVSAYREQSRLHCHLCHIVVIIFYLLSCRNKQINRSTTVVSWDAMYILHNISVYAFIHGTKALGHSQLQHVTFFATYSFCFLCESTHEKNEQ